MSSTVKEDCLKAHNDYRARHEDTPNMKWSDDLAQQAKVWADKIAADGKLAHCPIKDRVGQGENIACCKGKPMTGQKAADQWYAEIKDFDFDNKIFSSKTGHFSQVVWKESVELGAAIVIADNGYHFCVARYRCAGNLKGAFEKNIGDLKGQPKKAKPAGAATAAAPAPAPAGESLKEACLNAHNEYRSKHKDTPSMVWSDHLAQEAQKWADKIASMGKLQHCASSDRKGQGENIAAAKGTPMTGRTATDKWYREIKDFKFGNKVFASNTGHFTQVVWKESIELGAGIATSSTGFQFCVARYSVPGNLKGGFERNIGDLLSTPQDRKSMDQLRETIKNMQMNPGKTSDGKPIPTQDGNDLKGDCLNAHNEYRSKHKDTPLMKWSDELAQEAQKWASHLSATGNLAHCPAGDRKGQGENIACRKGPPMTGRFATDKWYGEIKDFDFKNKVFTSNTGHFTQVVWKESTELGAAIATASNGFQFCVARYRVPGNLAGSFGNNIGDLK